MLTGFVMSGFFIGFVSESSPFGVLLLVDSASLIEASDSDSDGIEASVCTETLRDLLLPQSPINYDVNSEGINLLWCTIYLVLLSDWVYLM